MPVKEDEDPNPKFKFGDFDLIHEIVMQADAINSFGWTIPPWSGGFLEWPDWLTSGLANYVMALEWHKRQLQPPKES